MAIKLILQSYVSWLEKPSCAPEVFKYVIADIFQCGAGLDWSIKVIQREENSTADRLAKSGISRSAKDIAYVRYFGKSSFSLLTPDFEGIILLLHPDFASLLLCFLKVSKELLAVEPLSLYLYLIVVLVALGFALLSRFDKAKLCNFYVHGLKVDLYDMTAFILHLMRLLMIQSSSSNPTAWQTKMKRISSLLLKEGK
ncbi:hypothetical protein V6N11_067332 [Hibiscus sabdariffa]|uniref:RNase H type-1 domain-containing protein n=1 Tax=Hibiscus sabdariffa TaxID=183260 RepID=A0ABR2SR98_9ROSI